MARHRSREWKASHADFIGIPRSVADSPAFIDLTAQARALYMDLRRQHNGKNNGDISVADSILKQYGWAHSSIYKNLALLLAHGLLVRTRDGGKASLSRIPTLYGFTDWQIIANPVKGISGSPPTHAYRQYVRGEMKQKRARRPRSASPPEPPQSHVESTHGERHSSRREQSTVHSVTPTPPTVHHVDSRFPPAHDDFSLSDRWITVQ